MLNCKYLIGDGHNTSFWLDHWFLDGPLIEHAIEWPTSFSLISEVNAEGNWNLDCLPRPELACFKMLIAPRRTSGHKTFRFQRTSPPLGHPLSSLVVL
ncbi:hypothetical protein NC651_018970 [Populus alba x Populus x berolinensis]|jgi:hypothetical protein|nr:hypothetical protein NC651_018970 [Populus alba x Populus x berolinensis]